MDLTGEDLGGGGAAGGGGARLANNGPVGGEGGGEKLQPVRQLLLDSLTPDSKTRVGEIIGNVENLSKFERLLLYMQLPASQLISDPLRQPINPLGSRSEIQLTIIWIRTHLEEDPQVSLPKHEVYDEYTEYCNDNGLKALSTADFGKVMKQVYPQVRPRRLGTRGNSRYCYAGLKKRVKLEEPRTPDCIAENGGKQVLQVQSERADDAAASLVLEWVEKLFNEKVRSIKDLALYLIDKMYVDGKSVQAQTLLLSTNVKSENRSEFNLPDIQEMSKKRSSIEEANSMMKLESQQPSYADPKRKKIDMDLNLDVNPSTSVSNNGGKMGSVVVQQLAQHQQQQQQQPTSSAIAALLTADSGKISKDDEEMSGFFRENSGHSEGPDDPAKHDKLSQLGQLLEKNLKSSPVSNLHHSAFRQLGHPADGGVSGNDPSSVVVGNGNVVEENHQAKMAQEWNGATEVNDDGANFGMNQVNVVVSSSENGGGVVGVVGVNANGTSLSNRRRVSFNPLVVQDVGSAPIAVNTNGNGHSSNGGGHGGMIQPSPGTRKRHFSFQPISPRQNSLPQSPTASPFISPRSTPQPMLRSRHSSGSALLPLHLLPQQQKISQFGSSSSDVSRAATFGSTSECSTPFISPHGTPIHFNRSRHNSAQGRLCRSRHSSGLAAAPYGRYNMTFSPMALNNLNNPYSPQPSTPLATMEDGMPTTPGLQQLPGGGFIPDAAMQAMHARSRHSSAESEPPGLGGSMMMVDEAGNPIGNTMGNMLSGNNAMVGGGGMISGRHRHASAGPIPSATMTFEDNDPWADGGKSGPSGGDETIMYSADPMDVSGGGGNGHVLNGNVGGQQSQGHQGQSGQDGGGGGGGGRGKEVPDDLDIALSALKDYDNDFSKLVEETEDGSVKK